MRETQTEKEYEALAERIERLQEKLVSLEGLTLNDKELVIRSLECQEGESNEILCEIDELRSEQSFLARELGMDYWSEKGFDALKDSQLKGWLRFTSEVRPIIDGREVSAKIKFHHKRWGTSNNGKKYQKFEVYLAAYIQGQIVRLDWVESNHEHMGRRRALNVGEFYHSSGWDRMNYAPRNLELSFKFKVYPTAFSAGNLRA